MSLKEEIERDIVRVDVNNFCYCLIHHEARCKAHKRMLESALSAVSKALEVAEEKCRSEMAGTQAEEMSRYDEGYDNACANNADAIREVREGLKG